MEAEPWILDAVIDFILDRYLFVCWYCYYNASNSLVNTMLVIHVYVYENTYLYKYIIYT